MGLVVGNFALIRIRLDQPDLRVGWYKGSEGKTDGAKPPNSTLRYRICRTAPNPFANGYPILYYGVAPKLPTCMVLLDEIRKRNGGVDWR